MKTNKILICLLLFFCFLLTSCTKKTEEQAIINEESFTFTIFSDVHYGTNNYNNFTCTDGLNKLSKIINETPLSDFYINLGDFIDNMKKNTELFDEAVDFLKERDIEIYNTGKVFNDNSRIMYTLIGNHETNTINKKDMGYVIPYVDNVGQVFSFKIQNVLFIALDANYSRETGTDSMQDMYCTQFTMPENEYTWFKNTIDENVNDSIDEIVLLSHIAVKDIDAKVFWKYVDYIRENYPTHHVTMFDGHTHTRSYNNFTDDDTNISYFTEYTLPAVTSNQNYEYYNVTFKGGKLDNIEMVLENAPLE